MNASAGSDCTQERRMTTGKLGLISHVAPGLPSGQGIVLGRLLREWPAGRVAVFTSGPTEAGGSVSPFPIHRLPAELPRLRRGNNALLPAALLRRARRLARLARAERCSLLLACTGDLLDLPATWLAARIAKLPFAVYLFDDYREQWRFGLQHRFSAALEPPVLRAAAGVIAPNEFMAAEYATRYRVSARLVRNPHPYADADLAARGEGSPAGAGDGAICYTGAVYDINYGEFRALARAVSDVPGLRLRIYTAQPPETLTAAGIIGAVDVLPHVAHDEVLRVQQKAGVLYLPLGRDPALRPVTRTAAPGKLGEYLASGRPVLAHVPADSFVSWYLRRHGCGLVVDDADDGPALAAALQVLTTDRDRCRAFVTAALERAATDFSADRARAAFASALASFGL